MRITDLRPSDEGWIHEAATLLLVGFKEHWPGAWPDLASAIKEVEESFDPDRISRVALDENDRVIGWVGGIKQHSGHVWELHPLVVGESSRGKGVGRALVEDLEEQVANRGAMTLWLGTDDEDNMTSISGIDLYPDLFEQLKNIKNLRNHPFEFYKKMGFEIVGVLPDANGPGKPDLFMAKRVSKR